MATLDDLADELLLATACLLAVRDVCRLGTTCRRLYCIAADPQLWRRLFVRDFAHLYKGIVDRPLIAACCTVESWPPEARLLCERTGAVSRMPPPCHRIADLPLPFAHAFAMGKDWQWLYRAHTVSLDERPHYTGPGTLSMRPDTIRVGDWVDGQRVGYAAMFYHGGYRWTEESRSSGDIVWSISCNSDSALYSTEGYESEMQHDGSQQEWTVWDTNTIVGNDEWNTWCTDVTGDNDDWRDASGVTIIVNQDKRLVEPHWQGDPHGVVRIHFSNGDTQAVRYEHGRYIDGVEFVCSSSCPVTEYAGRIFHCRWQPLSLPCPFLNHHLLVAADDGDQDSDDAGAFWHYVASGLVGWTDEVRRRALATTSYPFWPRAVALEKSGYAQ
ncbi:F-box incomplete domain containing protein [Pandoravirus quercus]|uniref:F-box incomplete domain containing protein n=1 Tax=Pandoravirus quercus TaxID=2107709 RepID=A0A2U7U9N7_9VIRU|nr:F-box incomplete domain containing protein [Pandoravirus quercus]AVK75157.1 F-box incomplete domain containing protein [Pandoravirus quercus]